MLLNLFLNVSSTLSASSLMCTEYRHELINIYEVIKMIKYHFKPLDKRAEVGVLLVVGDEGRLHSLSGAFNVHTRPIHLGQIHPLQVPQAPEQNLTGEEGSVILLLFSFTFLLLNKLHWSSLKLKLWRPISANVMKKKDPVSNYNKKIS